MDHENLSTLDDLHLPDCQGNTSFPITESYLELNGFPRLQAVSGCVDGSLHPFDLQKMRVAVRVSAGTKLE